MEPTFDANPALPDRFAAFFWRLWRRFGNALFWIAMFFVAVYFIFQSERFQQWAIQKITSRLSQDLKTRVEARRIDIDLFDKLSLEGFFVADQQGDTLLAAQRLTVGVESTLLELFGNGLEIREIKLENAVIDVKRRAGEPFDNAQFILDWLPKTKKSTSPKQPYSIAIGAIGLQNVRLSYRDDVKGKIRNVVVPAARARVRNLDLNSNVIDIDEIDLDGLSIDYLELVENPLPPALAAKLKKTAEPDTASRAAKKPLVFTVQKFNLRDGRFRYDRFDLSPQRTTKPTVLDTEHLLVENIALRIDSFKTLDGRSFFARVRNLAARESCGFQLDHLEATARLSDTLTELTQLRLRTQTSELSDSFSMRYERWGDFLNFNNRVKMEMSFRPGSRASFSDIAHFSSPLERNVFFKKNMKNVAELEGRVAGFVNDLRGRGVKLRVGSAGFIDCDFKTQNLSKNNDENPLVLNFKFRRLATDMQTLRDVVPGFNAPKQFDRLGDVAFEGAFDGFSSNFVVDGDVKTDLGTGHANMQLDLDKAVYSGWLDLKDFDLGRWTDRSDLGKATFKVEVQNGQGLRARDLKMDLKGAVAKVRFKGYDYQNLSADGKIDGFLFRGRLAAADPNLTGSLRGTVDFEHEPDLDINGEVIKADLQKLGFDERPLVVSGRLERLQSVGARLDSLVGSAVLRDLIVKENKPGGQIWSLPFAQLASEPRPNGERRMFLKSSVADLFLEGRFKPEHLSQSAIKVFEKYYPVISRRFGVQSLDSLPTDDRFRFSLTVFDSKNLLRLLDTSLAPIRGATVIGNFDGRGFIKATAQIPSVGYGGHHLQGVLIDWTTAGSATSASVIVDRTIIKGFDTLAPINIETRLHADTVHFGIDAANFTSVLNNLFLSGDLFPTDSVWQITFDPSNLTLLGDQWWIEADNFVRFSQNFIRTKNFQLRNGDRVVSLDSKEGSNYGLILSLNQFKFEELHRFWKYKKLTFRGPFEVWAEAENVFKMEGLKLYMASSDTLFINNAAYGTLDVFAEMKDLKSPADFSLNLMDQGIGQRLRAGGTYLPPSAPKALGKLRPGNFDLTLNGEKFPLAILETIISGISETSGRFDLTGKLVGSPTEPDLTGRARIRDGSVKIDYLGTGFSIQDQVISLSEKGIFCHDTLVDAIGIMRLAPDTVLDARGKPGIVSGGLWHRHFKNWRIDCAIESDDFLILKTTREQNPLYYGTGIAQCDIVFGGDFSETEIDITATTLPGSRLAIPITSTEEAGEVRFIKFIDKKQAQKTAEAAASSYDVDIDMKLTLTPDAEVQLIFDEAVGDVIKGQGAGDLQIAYDSKAAQLTMYGDYTIERGEYLFTYFAFTFLNVSKPFIVQPGGTISWSGDPYTAQLNLKAEYKGLSIAPYNLIAEEVELFQSDALSSEARRSTRVALTLGMTGDLLKPNISFDIQFPDLQGSLRTAAENSLRLLRQDPNELNRQVFGLIAMGSFLPAGSGLLGGDGVSGLSITTLSQFVASQFSNHFTALANTLVGDKVFSSFDFDVAFNRFLSSTEGANFNNNELALRLSTGLAGNRVTISSGVNLGVFNANSATSTDGFLGEDVVVEFRLTDDRKWRARVFQRTERNLLFGFRSTFGGGLSWRQEFDSFREMWEAILKKN